MRRMSDPDYIYRPTPASVRAKQSKAHRARLGIADGYGLVYGITIPQRWVAVVRTAALKYRHPYGRKKRSLAATKRFTKATLLHLLRAECD